MFNERFFWEPKMLLLGIAVKPPFETFMIDRDHPESAALLNSRTHYNTGYNTFIKIWQFKQWHSQQKMTSDTLPTHLLSFTRTNLLKSLKWWSFSRLVTSIRTNMLYSVFEPFWSAAS